MSYEPRPGEWAPSPLQAELGRRALGLTRRQMAARLGMHPNTLARVETGGAKGERPPESAYRVGAALRDAGLTDGRGRLRI